MSAFVLLQACAGPQFDNIPHSVGGLPENAPQRLAEAPAFPAVHDMPPTRTAAVLDAEQQKKLQEDLIATRNRQPNQAKNIALDKKKAEEAGKAKEKEKSKAKKKGGKSGISPSAKRPDVTETAGASRNP